MKRTIYERINYRLRDLFYKISHPLYISKYSKRFMNDFSQEDLEYCVSHLYELNLRKKIDFGNVKTFNEKLNWLKCFYHNNQMTECADKVMAPNYFKRKTGLGDEYIVKNLGVFKDSNEIDFQKLPEQFVLKSNWGSGKQIIVKNKSSEDIKEIKSKISKWNNSVSNHYYYGFEYSYKNIEPRIVCEEFIKFEYKIEFFCFNGQPYYFWTVFNDKTDDVCADFYDAISLKKIRLKHGYPNSNNTIEIPDTYQQMYNIANLLSEDFPFVRIDFFKTNEGFKFSEMTFYHWCGFMPFEPEIYDLKFGEKIRLPNIIQ